MVLLAFLFLNQRWAFLPLMLGVHQNHTLTPFLSRATVAGGFAETPYSPWTHLTVDWARLDLTFCKIIRMATCMAAIGRSFDNRACSLLHSVSAFSTALAPFRVGAHDTILWTGYCIARQFLCQCPTDSTILCFEQHFPEPHACASSTLLGTQ